MATVILAEVAVASVAVFLAAILGYFFDKYLCCFMLTLLTTISCGLCILGTWHWGLVGLLGTILLVGVMGAGLGYKLSKRRGAWTVGLSWLGFCATCLFSYWAAGWVGLLTITLPSLILFWGGLVFISGYILPLQDSSQRIQAFRSLLTFRLGTNYPYYVVEDWKRDPLEPRVSGKTSQPLFGGPGIVITSCDHLVTISAGISFEGVKHPGLTFTGQYQNIGDVIDLRPQLRAFTVLAETKDGVPIEVVTFVPFRIDVLDRQPVLGESYPYNEDAVFRAVHRQPLGHRWERDAEDRATEDQAKIPWDDLVPMIAPPLLKNVIIKYTCDELCTPGAREEIKRKFLDDLGAAVRPWGVQLVSGGISNLMPADDSVIEQRIENWKAKWKREIEVELGKGEAKALSQMESVRTRAQLEAMQPIAKIFADKDLSEHVIALRLIEAIEEMASHRSVQQALPTDASETIKYLSSAREFVEWRGKRSS